LLDTFIQLIQLTEREIVNLWQDQTLALWFFILQMYMIQLTLNQYIVYLLLDTKQGDTHENISYKT